MKSKLSIRIRRWNLNRTVIDDQIWTEISIWRRRFNSVLLIALAYMLKVEGSKHVLPETSLRFVKPCLEHVARDLMFMSRNLDFQTGKSDMKSTYDHLWEDRGNWLTLTSLPLVSTSLADVPWNVFGGQDRMESPSHWIDWHGFQEAKNRNLLSNYHPV